MIEYRPLQFGRKPAADCHDDVGRGGNELFGLITGDRYPVDFGNAFMDEFVTRGLQVHKGLPQPFFSLQRMPRKEVQKRII